MTHELRLPTRDGHEISDGGGTLSPAVCKANLSGQRWTLDRDEDHALGIKTAHGLRHKRNTEASGYHRNSRCHLRRLLSQIRNAPGADKGCDNGVIDRWIDRAREKNETILSKRRQRRRFRLSERMCRWQNHDNAFFHQRLELEPIRIRERRSDEGEVDSAGAKASQQQRRVAFFRRQNDVGMLLSEFANDGWNQRMELGRTGRADIDLSCFAAGTPRHARLGTLD